METKSDKLVSVFREKIEEAKASAGKKDDSLSYAIGLLAGALFLLAVKTAVISCLAWLGTGVACDIFGYQHPTYLQVLTILVAVKSVFFYMFDKDKKEAN